MLSLVNRGFFVLLTVAALVTTPVGYYLLTLLLESVYPYHLTLGSFVLVSDTVNVMGVHHAECGLMQPNCCNCPSAIHQNYGVGVLAYGLLVLTALLTLSTRFHRIAHANPVEVLRDE